MKKLQSQGTIFRLFGIDIRLHFSWYFIAIFISWSLAAGFFPSILPGKTIGIYWFMGIIAALLLFASVLLHELSHSLVAKAKNIKVESITLFFFGGVAGIGDEDMKPSTEFLMAIAGPLFSLLLSGVFFLIHSWNGNEIVGAITLYLYQLNFMLALFNLVPGFPLDGGRAFRAILYWHYDDVKKATRIAVMGGKFFAGVLMILGLLSLLAGQAGLWFMLLGGFLYFIAGVSYEQVVVRETLRPILVVELLSRKIPIVRPEIKFIQFKKKYQASDQEVFLVKGKNFAGLLDFHRLEKIPLAMQEMVTVQQLALSLSEIKSLSPRDTAYTAFTRFGEQNLASLPVMEKGKLLGVVTRRKVMYRLAWLVKYGL